MGRSRRREPRRNYLQAVHEHSGRVQDALDAEFFENHYLDAPRADQLSLRVAANLGGEQFEISRLAAEFNSRNANATQQSINRLLKSNHIFRVSQGVYV